MMILYNLFIRSYAFGIGFAALFGNKKASAWLKGRKDWRSHLAKSIGSEKVWVWFHCASLGEFEQGRPLIEEYRRKFPERKILLTFFSPSGFEVRKDYDGADAVYYLPLDTPVNAKDFIDIVRPFQAFFIKYEFWFNLLEELDKSSIPHYLVSGIFRSGQWIFLPTNRSFLKRLARINRFFLQDKNSVDLLTGHGISNTILAGDTRFDRVVEVAAKPSSLPDIEEWSRTGVLIVAGSTWPEDEYALLKYLRNAPAEVKLLLVPHEVTESHLEKIRQAIQKNCPDRTFEYHSRTSGRINTDILVIDRIGLLSRLYRYATITYIGGGFGAGIHNTLEAAVYGKALFFGPAYSKFKEAVELIESEAAFPCQTIEEVGMNIKRILDAPELKTKAEKAAFEYVQSHTGATKRILERL